MGSSSPIFGVKIRNIWNHHLETLHSPSENWVLSNQHSARSVGGTSPQVHVQSLNCIFHGYWTGGAHLNKYFKLLTFGKTWKDYKTIIFLPNLLVLGGDFHLWVIQSIVYFPFFPNITRFFGTFYLVNRVSPTWFCPLKYVGTLPPHPPTNTQQPPRYQPMQRTLPLVSHHAILAEGWPTSCAIQSGSILQVWFQKWLAQRHFEKSGLYFIRAKLQFLNLNQGILNRIPSTKISIWSISW